MLEVASPFYDHAHASSGSEMRAERRSAQQGALGGTCLFGVAWEAHSGGKPALWLMGRLEDSGARAEGEELLPRRLSGMEDKGTRGVCIGRHEVVRSA